MVKIIPLHWLKSFRSCHYLQAKALFLNILYKDLQNTASDKFLVQSPNTFPFIPSLDYHCQGICIFPQGLCSPTPRFHLSRFPFDRISFILLYVASLQTLYYIHLLSNPSLIIFLPYTRQNQVHFSVPTASLLYIFIIFVIIYVHILSQFQNVQHIKL